MPTPRVIKLAPGEDGPAWAKALADPTWRNQATKLKEDTDASVWRATLLGRDVVVKCWSLSRLKRRIQAYARATPAQKQWRGSTILQECEVPTADPFVIVRHELNDEPIECLVVRLLPGKSVLEHLAHGDLSVRQEHAVARVIGFQLAQLMQHGKYNRDHKPSNLIITKLGDATPIVAIIDTVAIRRTLRDLDHFSSMLAALMIEPTGCNCAPKRTLAMRCLHEAMSTLYEGGEPISKGLRTLRNDIWAAVELIIFEHGDPTPKVDPLVNVRRSVEKS